MQNFWYVVGVLLLGWVAFDLYAGYTLLHDVIYRDQNPTLYWTGVGVWFALAVSCFFSWNSDEDDYEKEFK